MKRPAAKQSPSNVPQAFQVTSPASVLADLNIKIPPPSNIPEELQPTSHKAMLASTPAVALPPSAIQAQLPDTTGLPSPADDLLVGAGAISQFLFGTAAKRRSVYYLMEQKVLPAFRWGGQLVARKSTLLDFLAAREASALRSLSIDPAE